MDKTSLGFQKPKEEEYYDINIFNQNAQLANDLIEKNSSAIGQKLDKNSSFYADLEAYYGNTKLIDDFTDKRNWSVGSGTLVENFSNYKINSYSLSLLESDDTTGYQYMGKAINLDLSKLSNGEDSGEDDYICLSLFIPDLTKLDLSPMGGVRLFFDQTFPTNGANMKYKVFTGSELTQGWNFLKVKKSDFGTNGTGKWDGVQGVHLRWYSVANAKNTYVSFQFLQMIKKDPLEAKPNPLQKNGVRELAIDEQMYGEEYILYKKDNQVSITVMNSIPSLFTFKHPSVAAENQIISATVEKYSSFAGYLSYMKDINNRVSIFFNKEEAFLTAKINGVEKIIREPIKISSNIVNLSLEKRGNTYIGGVTTDIEQKSLILKDADLGDVFPYLGIGSNLIRFMSFGVTQLKHSYHSEVSEVAHRLTHNPCINPNLLINPGFLVWQRGTNFTGFVNQLIKYTADRWYGVQSKGAKLGVSLLPNEGIRVTQSGVGTSHIGQFVEGSYDDLLGKTMTASIRVKMNCDIMVQVLDGNTPIRSRLLEAKASYEDYSLTFRMPTSLQSNKLRIIVLFYNSQGYMDIKHIKLEVGSIATEHSPRPQSEELLLCLRYCLGGAFLGTQLYASETTIWFSVSSPVPLRTDPVITNVGDLKVHYLGSPVDGFVPSIILKQVNGFRIAMTKSGHGLTANTGLYSTTAIFDMELYG